MGKRRRFHLILFAPDPVDGEPPFDWRTPLARVFPGVAPVPWPKIAGAGDEPARREALVRAMRGAGPRGFAITDPPEDVEELRWIDGVAREVFGRRRRHLPKAIFFTPRAKRGKGEDPLEGYRKAIRPVHHHYRKDRRAFSFDKAKPRAVRKALKLSKKSKSPIRWGLVLPMAGVVAGVLLLTFVFRDGLLRRGAIAGGQSAFGARVEVAGLQTTFEPSLRLQDVAVADKAAPMTNLFEFDSLAAEIDLFALLAGRVHVADATLGGLEFDTARAESGALDDAPLEDEDEDPPSPFSVEMERRLLQVVDDLQRALEPPTLDELETARVSQELAVEARDRLARLRENASTDGWKQRFEDAREELRSLVEQPVPASLGELREALSGLDAFGDVDVAALQERLAAVADLGFDDEAALLDKARSKTEAARSDLQAARATLGKARKIEKLDFGTLAKLPGLLDELRGSIDRAETAGRQLDRARELAQRAARDLPRTQEAGTTQLADLRSALADARTAADEASGAGDELAGLTGLLESAKSDVLARKDAVRSARDELVHEVDALRSDIESIRSRVQSDLDFLASGRERLETAVQTDVDALQSRYSLDAIDTDQILATLVGEQAFGWLDTGRRLYRRLRPPAADGEPKKLVDGHGTTYEFPAPADPELPNDDAFTQPADLPGLYVERAGFDGILSFGGKPLQLLGTAAEISSNPAVTGRDATVEFGAERDGEAVSGDLRFTTEHALRASFSARDFRVEDVPFGTRYAPERIEGARLTMGLDALFDDDVVTASVDLSLKDLVLAVGTFDGLDPEVAAILSDVYRGFDALDARVELEADRGGLRALRVESDALDGMRDALQGAAAEHVAELRAEAEADLAARIDAARTEALSALGDFEPEARSLVESLAAEGESAESLVDVDKRAVRKLFSSELDLPVLGGDSESTRAALQERLATLSGELDAEDSRLSAAHAAQASALEAVLGDLGAVEDLESGLEEKLQAELQRLLKLK